MNSRFREHADILTFDPDDFGVDELREAVFGNERASRLPKNIALSVLRRKDYPEKLADFERVLLNERESPRVRHAAAMELGRIGTREATELLHRSTISLENDLVLRGVITSLSRVGDEEALRAINEVRDRRNAVQTSDWAASLLAYQLGVEGFELGFPRDERFLSVDPRRVQEIRFEATENERAAKAVRDVSSEVGELFFDTTAVTTLRCGDQSLLYLPNRDFVTPDAPQRLLRRKAVLGVLAARYTLERDTWSARYFVLTQPSEEPDTVELLLTATAGTLAYAGRAKMEHERLSFALRTVEHGGAVPVEIEGTYDRGRLRLERARAELRRRNKLDPRPRDR